MNEDNITKSKSKSFWSRPEGVTGIIFLLAILFAGTWAVASFLGAIAAFLSTTAGLVTMMLVLGSIIFMALDKNMRTLIGYMYRSVMRWITGLFVQIDPIGILRSYVADLKSNLLKMNKQLNQLRGQMHKLQEMIVNNKKTIESNLTMASKAKEQNKQAVMVLKSRKAGRLKESNMRLEDLYRKMEILYRVLGKMYENSSILVEDVEDQVMVKEQERKAISASHSAIRSAMSIIKGDADKLAMFDMAMEAIADDVSQKVGEMERFMQLSQNFMQSIDLQNGVFEEEGLKMLEKWEKEGTSLLLGTEKQNLLDKADDENEVLDLSAPIRKPEKVKRTNQYDSLFE